MKATDSEGRPAANGPASESLSDTIASVTAARAAAGLTRSRPELTPAEVYEIIRGRLAAHVITKDTAGRVTCRSYVNLKAADRAVQRAHERHQAATVVMVRQDVAPLISSFRGDRP